MAIVTINPKSANRPYLKLGGTYGNGHQHQAEVELSSFELPSEKGPGYDRDCKEDSYCQFTFNVRHPEFGFVQLRHWEPLSEGSGSRALQFVANLGVSIDENTGQFDEAQVAPRACAIEVRDPRQDKENRWWTGNVLNVIGVS